MILRSIKTYLAPVMTMFGIKNVYLLKHTYYCMMHWKFFFLNIGKLG